VPLKSKTATAVSAALRTYMSFMGIPEVVISDNDTSFRGETETLFRTYNITHHTSYPYTQRGNTVEAQVRKFLNAARSSIMDNPLLKHTEWHCLYPLVLVRLNSLTSKYGLSREYAHFKEINENHLPLITEVNIHEDLQQDLDHTAYNFRGAIQKFMKNKGKSKSYYKDLKKQTFCLHELVYRRDYTPSTTLASTYIGPYRILEIYPQGVLLKDPKTGELLSVHIRNLRKLTPDEFLMLLPKDFDSEILKTFGKYRYNKAMQPDTVNKANVKK
jgi:hypothetical protein